MGALVYCRVAVANKDMDAELSCIGASAHTNTNTSTTRTHAHIHPAPFSSTTPRAVTQGVKKDWMTGESTFGELKGGTLTRCSLGLCRQ